MPKKIKNPVAILNAMPKQDIILKFVAMAQVLSEVASENRLSDKKILARMVKRETEITLHYGYHTKPTIH